MLELEVKVLNVDLDLMEKKLLDLGAKLIDHEKQKNIIIDRPDSSIQKDLDAYLRIREKRGLDGRTTRTLTFKKSLGDSELRKNVELDLTINSQEEEENLLKILSQLGYGVVSIGYKDRRSLVWENIRFDLDIWDKDTYPYPYMEIELEREEDLARAIRLLDLDPKNISTDSIVDLKNKL